ncbi:MAG TPA: imelysin family protein [Roseomonas sp.]|jgi:hypothetical protein
MPSRRLILAALPLLLARPVRAQTASRMARQRVVEAAKTALLAPHRAFAEAAERFMQATAALRDAPSPAAAAAARGAWVAANLAFQGVRHLRFGPMDAFDRGFRLSFFPDQRNATGRDLTALLRDASQDALEAIAAGRGRVPVQGLPAAERLLVAEGEAPLLQPGETYRRALLAAIARNIATIAGDLATGWTGDPFGAGGDPEDALLLLFKSLHGGLDFVGDRLLARTLGPSLREARPRLSEAWRSGQSLALARGSIEALAMLHRTAFAGLLAASDAALARAVDQGFAELQAAAQRIAPSLEAAVATADGRSAVEDTIRALGALRRLLAERGAPALGLPVGFNSMDGD